MIDIDNYYWRRNWNDNTTTVKWGGLFENTFPGYQMTCFDRDGYRYCPGFMPIPATLWYVCRYRTTTCLLDDHHYWKDLGGGDWEYRYDPIIFGTQDDCPVPGCFIAADYNVCPGPDVGSVRAACITPLVP